MCINKSVNKSIIHTSITTDCYTLEISTVMPHIYVYRYIYQSDLMKCKSPFRTQPLPIEFLTPHRFSIFSIKLQQDSFLIRAVSISALDSLI